jgi:sterol desaturase/sphingolipid hydroxylase (fatty acid hydroxylase superfamily)
MSTLVRATRVLLILMLAMLVISLVMAVAASDTGLLEKVVLLLLIGGCLYAAARVTELSQWLLHRLHH